MWKLQVSTDDMYASRHKSVVKCKFVVMSLRFERHGAISSVGNWQRALLSIWFLPSHNRHYLPAIWLNYSWAEGSRSCCGPDGRDSSCRTCHLQDGKT